MSTLTTVVYRIEIELETKYMTDQAQKMVPDMIRQFGSQLVVKSALISGEGAVKFKAVVEGPPDFIEIPLITD